MDSYTPSTDSSTKQLDLLLAHVAKEFSGSVLRIPDHLVDDFRRLQDEGISVMDGKQTASPPAILMRELTNTTNACNTVQEPATERVLCNRAFRTCASRVVGLQEWQICVEENLTRSEHSRQVLQYVLDIINSMRDVTKLIQNQSDFLSHNASVLLAGCAKLERVQAELQENLHHFSKIEDLNFETKGETLSATSPRFYTLFQDLENEIQFLYEHRSFKSAPAYAAKLTEAQQRVLNCLKVVLENSFATALQCALQSNVYKGLVMGIILPNNVVAHPSPSSGSTTSKIPNTSAEAEGETLKDAGDNMESNDAEKTLEGQRSMASTLSGSESLVPLSNNASITSQGIVNTLKNGLRSINQVYLDKLNENTLLRRMIETQKGFSYAGDQTFGEETLQRIETNFQLQEILKAYQESRIELVSPLLQQCLKLCCHVDATDASALLEETLERFTSFETRSESFVSLSTSGAHGIKKSNSRIPDERQTLAQNASIYSLPRLVSYICVLLQVIIPLERDVMESLWMRDDFIAWLSPKMVSEMVDGLYRQFRSRLLRVDNITELCYTVEYIQTIHTRQSMENSQLRELSDLWVSMVQDTQERIVFRAGDYLRNEIAYDPPTKELAKRYALAGEDAKVTTGIIEPPPEAVCRKMFYVPGMLKALNLLNLLYPAIEFPVFSVFAEEIIDKCLKLVQVIGKPVHDYCVSAPADESLPSLMDWGEVKASLCQLAHLLHLRQELTQIDAKIAVVDKSLNFSKLAMERKLEITQSSRESKTKVDAEVHTYATYVSRALQKTIALPLTGATRMSATAREKALENMEHTVTRAKRVLSWFVSQDVILYERLLENLEEGVRELTKEVAELPPPPVP